ncbi:MAG: hypothetical protein LBP65_01565 [Puniceicoccales bacterium]|jgi:hypothetical protein|nr:hypothetical protein [Puniceicoccales bacterium]
MVSFTAAIAAGFRGVDIFPGEEITRAKGSAPSTTNLVSSVGTKPIKDCGPLARMAHYLGSAVFWLCCLFTLGLAKRWFRGDEKTNESKNLEIMSSNSYSSNEDVVKDKKDEEFSSKTFSDRTNTIEMTTFNISSSNKNVVEDNEESETNKRSLNFSTESINENKEISESGSQTLSDRTNTIEMEKSSVSPSVISVKEDANKEVFDSNLKPQSNEKSGTDERSLNFSRKSINGNEEIVNSSSKLSSEKMNDNIESRIVKKEGETYLQLLGDGKDFVPFVVTEEPIEISDLFEEPIEISDLFVLDNTEEI